MLKARIITGASAGREKQMTRKPVSKIIAFVTAVCTMAVMCGMPAVAFAWEGGVTKEETVYVVTDSSGAQSDVIVSDHLVNKGKSKTISDETTLTDIENVKGEETFKQKGDALTWKAEGNSIYYQGKTDAEVPVTMDITDRLNDKVVSGPELQGESGKVEIRIHYENNAEYNGTTVPFIVMTGLIVTDDSFKNIKVTKGKVIDDGEKLLVVGMAAPGLAQTLDIGESDLGIGSTVTITGDADKFAVEDMMTIVTNAFFEDIDSDGVDLDYDDEIDALNKGSKALVDGSKLLHDGLETMDDSMPTLEEGISGLKAGADQLNAGTKSAQEGANALNQGIQLIKDLPEMMQTMSDNLAQMKGVADGIVGNLGSIETGINQAISGLTMASASQNDVVKYLNDLKDAYDKLDENEQAKVKAVLGDDIVDQIAVPANDEKSIIRKASTVKTTIDQVKGTKATEDSAATGLEAASAGIISISNYMNLIDGGLDQMNSEISSQLPTLSAGIPKLVGGAQTLKNGEDQLATGAQALANGMNSLQDKSGSLIDGVKKLDKGSLELSNGMAKLYNEGIKKIIEMYNDDLKGTLDSVDGMLDAGRGYKTFTKLPSGMDGNVKFIYKTDMTE